MSRRTQEYSAWNEEIAKIGLKATIIDRMKFHGGLSLKFVMNYTGCAMATAKKHLDRMVDQGLALKEVMGDTLYYRDKTSQ